MEDKIDILDRIRGYSARFHQYGAWVDVMDLAIKEIEELRKERDSLKQYIADEQNKPRFIFNWNSPKEKKKSKYWFW